MTATYEAMKLAREALSHTATDLGHPNFEVEEAALVALDFAIEAQPEQEPCGEAYLCDRCYTPFNGAYECPECGHNTATLEPVYTTPPQRKPLTDERKEAMQIYTPPFKYHRGYIHDAEGHMVSDDDEVQRTVAHRVRGWGRISYMPNAEAIQDEIGVMMADALTEYYAAHGIKGAA